MQTWERDTSLKKEVTDMSDEAFEIVIKDLLFYSEALKSYLDQIELSRTFENS